MKSSIVVLATTALIASASLASAATISETQSYGPATTDWGTAWIQVDDGNGGTIPVEIPDPIQLHFNGFSSFGIAGTLSGVMVTVTETTQGSITNSNTGSVAAVVTSSILNSQDAYLPTELHLTTNLSATASTLSGATISSDVIEVLAAGGTGTPTNVNGSSSLSATSVAGDDLSAYNQGFDIGADDWGSVTVSATPNNGTAVYTDQGKISVTVTYTYDPVSTPEPATLALLGGSLFGLGLIRRRR